MIRPCVLLVDDVEANLIALEGLLEDLDCQLIRASSGNEALRQLLKREFAVMLLDVQMPEMDGYEVARLARQHPATSEVPIIFLTASHESEESLVRGYGSGAVDYLFKPINAVVLRSKVRVFLELYNGRRRLADTIEAHRKTLGELELARQQAEQASRFKSQFLANVSHELRTPLNAIIGFSEILQDGSVGPLVGRQSEFLDHIATSGRHLLSLIGDILDLSKVEAGRIELRREWISVETLVTSTGHIIRPLAHKRGVKIGFEVQPGLPEIHVDPVRFKQILYNLLSNAIKFTANGGAVRLYAERTGDHVSIAVEDTGIGIASENLPRLFQEFERIETGPELTSEGTGLGLALTKRLVELHGGRVTVDSEPQRGSTFKVELPLPPAQTQAQAQAQTQTQAQTKGQEDVGT